MFSIFEKKILGKKYKIQDLSSGYIKCISCEELKPLDDYYKSKGYYIYRCKPCFSKKHTENYIPKEKKIKVVSHEQSLFNQGLKTCRMCGEVKSFESFQNQSPKKLVQSKCKQCINKTHYENSKKRLELNPELSERRRESQKRYHHNNREKKIEYGRQYRKRESEKKRIVREERKLMKLKELEQKLKLREEKREEKRKLLEEKRKLLEEKKESYRKLQEYWKSEEFKLIKKQKEKDRGYKKWKRRWNEDEMFAMKVRLRNLIRNSFRRHGYKKFNLSTESIVGLNYDGFKEYLESKFLEGMTWENRGEWHIDHIIPLSSASSKDDLIRLCHYTNLQPLWAIDNMKKGDKIL